jgi:hypothetical protein
VSVQEVIWGHERGVGSELIQIARVYNISSMYSTPPLDFLGFGGGVCPIGGTLDANFAGRGLGQACRVSCCTVGPCEKGACSGCKHGGYLQFLWVHPPSLCLLQGGLPETMGLGVRFRRASE